MDRLAVVVSQDTYIYKPLAPGLYNPLMLKAALFSFIQPLLLLLTFPEVIGSIELTSMELMVTRKHIHYG